jgi:4-hydroxy-3-methylbut-2-enyl diphosphate reductase
VVGSERSSNSKRLVQVVEERAKRPAYLVDTYRDIKPEWLAGKKKVGVTSGASTPTHLTREVVEYLEGL